VEVERSRPDVEHEVGGPDSMVHPQWHTRTGTHQDRDTAGQKHLQKHLRLSLALACKSLFLHSGGRSQKCQCPCASSTLSHPPFSVANSSTLAVLCVPCWVLLGLWAR